MRKNGDLSKFEGGIVVGVVSQAGLSVLETGHLLGFSQTNISRFYREWCEREKIQVGGERPDCFELAGRQQ